MENIEIIIGIIIVILAIIFLIMVPFGFAFILFGFIAYSYLHMTGIVWWSATILLSLMYSAVFYAILYVSS